jgi:hypothetical protein
MYNILDLSNCASSQLFYMCFARGSSLSQTLIIQGFESSVITDSVPGELRTEFCALEVLNDITRRAYEGNLDPSVRGFSRTTLIHQYQKVYRSNAVPENVHTALDWSDESDVILVEDEPSSEWSVVSKPCKTTQKDKGEGVKHSNKHHKASQNYDALKHTVVAPGFVLALGSVPLPFLSQDPGDKSKSIAKKASGSIEAGMVGNVPFHQIASSLKWRSSLCAQCI